MDGMNWVDTVIASIVAFNLWTGLRRGLIAACLDIVAAIAAVYAALKLYPLLLPIAANFLHLPQFVAYLLSFAVVWLLVFGLIQILSVSLNEIFNRSIFAPLNLFGGLMIGMVRGFIIALFIFVPLTALPLMPLDLSSALHRSVFLEWSKPWVNDYVPQFRHWSRQTAAMEQTSLNHWGLTLTAPDSK